MPTQKVTASYTEKVQLEFYGEKRKVVLRGKHQTPPDDDVLDSSVFPLSFHAGIQLISKVIIFTFAWVKSFFLSLCDFQMLLQRSVAPVGK